MEPAADVVVSDALGVLSAAGSVWHREDIIRVFCDMQRPIPRVGGTEWAQIIERAADRVIEACVDFDPDRPSDEVCGRVRGSDGRFAWIEPVAAHITSEPILMRTVPMGRRLRAPYFRQTCSPPTVPSAVTELLPALPIVILESIVAKDGS